MKKNKIKLKGYWSNNRSKSNLKLHLILVTKYRHKLFNDELNTKIKAILTGLSNSSSFDIIEMETDVDHIHIMLQYSQQYSVSQIVRQIKQITTFQLWKSNYSFLRKFYWYRNILWTDGYFACSIGEASPKTIRNYIKNQG